MRVSKIQNNNQQTSFKAVSPKFQPPRVVLKEKMKCVSVKTLDMLETAAEVPIALFYILRKPLTIFAVYCATIGISTSVIKAFDRGALKEKMNNKQTNETQEMRLINGVKCHGEIQQSTVIV